MPNSSRSNAIALSLASVMLAAGAVPALSTDYRRLTIDGAAVRWHPGASRAGFTLRYAVTRATAAIPGAINCSPLAPPHRLVSSPKIGSDRFRGAVRKAFERWEAVTAIRFVEVADDATADIVIGEQADPKGHAFTNLSLGGSPNEAIRPITRAAICLNPDRSWKIGFDGNLASYDLVHTLTHEIGHAIGLDHPGPRGHLMSFRYDERLPGLSPGDVLGAQAIYGTPHGQAAPYAGTITAQSQPEPGSAASSITRAFDGDGDGDGN